MSRCFAIVPAAGQSTRMGQPKLRMMLGERPLIVHTIEAWQRSNVDRILVVVRPDDEALAEIVRSAGGEIIMPESPPPDMKSSVQSALRRIATMSPTAADAVLVAPADIPRLSPAVIDRLIGKHRSASQPMIMVPTISGRRGHPVLIPWPVAADVHRLKPEEGLNAIVERAGPRLTPCEDLVIADDCGVFADIDTPEDFRRLEP